MSLIQLPHTITVKKNGGVDRWGILQKGTVQTDYKARVSYKIDTVVAGKTTGQPVINVIPQGSMIIEVAAQFTHDDLIEITAKDGKKYEVKPKEIKPINDFYANPMYWKVTY